MTDADALLREVPHALAEPLQARERARLGVGREVPLVVEARAELHHLLDAID